MKEKRIWIVLLLASALLAACGPQNQLDAGTPLQVWIDAPLNNSAIPEAAYTLVFSGASFGDPIGNFDVLVNGSAESSVPALYQTSQADANYSYAQYEWLPPSPGSYLIQVRAYSGDQASALVQAYVVVGGPGEEPLPEEDFSEEPDAPEDLLLIAIPSQNTNCRLGNSSTYFDIADTLFEGDEYSPAARGQDNLWLYVPGPVYGSNCWAYIESIELFLNGELVAIEDVPLEILPVVPYPPLPTATPTPTLEPTATPEPTATERLPECSDGIDNDGDGDIDMSDGRCLSPDDDSESS
jgi:hypothetical protein